MRRLLQLAALAGAGVVCALLVTDQQNKAMDVRADQERKREVARWLRGAYIATTNVAELESRVVARIQECDTNGLLKQFMVERLASSVRAMCQAYSEGDFEAFIEFRLPAPDDQAFEIAPAQLALQKKNLPAFPAVEAGVRARRGPAVHRPISLDSALGVLEAWWYLTVPTIRDSEFPGESFFCHDCWREFSPQRFNVLVERRQDSPEPLGRIVWQLARETSVMEMQPMIAVKPPVEEVLERGQPVVFAHCLVPVKLKRQIKARPVVVSFFWSETRQKFLPYRMGVLARDLAVYYVF